MLNFHHVAGFPRSHHICKTNKDGRSKPTIGYLIVFIYIYDNLAQQFADLKTQLRKRSSPESATKFKGSLKAHNW